MNNTNKLIAILIFSGLLLTTTYYFWNNNRSQAKEYQAIKIAIKQLSENNLNLTEINLRKTYPAKEFTNKSWQKYYTAKILDDKGNSLYTTTIPKQYLISRFTYPDYQTTNLIVKNNDNIDLFLPVFPKANKLVIENELGHTLMSINLKNLEE